MKIIDILESIPSLYNCCQNSINKNSIHFIKGESTSCDLLYMKIYNDLFHSSKIEESQYEKYVFNILINYQYTNLFISQESKNITKTLFRKIYLYKE